jgi:two-component system, LytTR family, response regulator
MRTIIIDDELESRQANRLTISRYCPDIALLGEADSVVSGLDLIARLHPELVFLDVQMQDGTGFDLLEKIEQINFQVIFVTSFDHFALKAFRFSALDYLLKPIEPELLIKAVHKAKQVNLQGFVKQQVDIAINSNKVASRIALPTFEGLEMINLDEIVYCESDSNYTTFYLLGGAKYVASRTMKEYEAIFPDDRFLRIHKSYIINLNHVSRYIKGEGGQVVMSSGSMLPVSRLRKDMLISRLRVI